MYTLLIAIHVTACLILIGVVLLQQGKGADMGAVFGGSSQTLFGSGGAGNFLTRITGGAAAVFLVTSLGLAYMSAERVTTTIFDDAPAPVIPATESAPAPAADAPAPAPAADAKPAEAAPAADTKPADSAPAAAAPADPQAQAQPEAKAAEAN